MSYKIELTDRISDSRLWPDFARSGFLSELNGIAEDAFLYDTIYGYLSSVLIYHQLAEEVIGLVLENAKFLIQLAIFPVEIKFPKQKDRMFGEILRELEFTVEFKQKAAMLKKARELNEIRNQIVHKLTKQTSLEEVKEQAVKVKKLFDETFTLSREANGYFYQVFSDYKKNVDWQEFLDGN